ncbi:MAG: ferredoxin:protochlorophyllide reductase (ATP-dependent) subunit B, partial [Blastomonas fulva]
VMGLEEHLLTMFRDDPEFHDGAGASHLAHGTVENAPVVSLPKEDRHVEPAHEPVLASAAASIPAAHGPAAHGDVLELTRWTAEAETELKKIPFFVRGKARRNTEAYAAERGLASITIDTLYDAKAHYAR